MISGTVIYEAGPQVAELFAAPGVTVSIYNPDTTQTLWLSTRAGNLKVGFGIPVPPTGIVQWDADKACYAVAAATQLVAVTDNAGALNFQGPTLTQITAAVPTAATIDGQPNSAGAASAATGAQSNSAVARIRSMTRAQFTVPNGFFDVSVPISVANINRCQLNLLGTYVNSGSATIAHVPAIVAVSNTSVDLHRFQNAFDAWGYVEIMEWI